MKRTPPTKRRPKTETMDHKPSRHLDGVQTVDWQDYDMLRKFVTEHGKIIPARLTGATAKQQRQIKHGVRRARETGLLG